MFPSKYHPSAIYIFVYDFKNYIFEFNKAKLLGCIMEKHVGYPHQNIASSSMEETAQACAERCASTEECLFWTWGSHRKDCNLKSSDSDRRFNGGVISGTRACGLSKRTTSPRLTSVGVVASKEHPSQPPSNCADSTHKLCIVQPSPAPWLALYLGSRAQVDKIKIVNRRMSCCGERLRNFTIRVTDALPSSGDLFVILFIVFL